MVRKCRHCGEEFHPVAMQQFCGLRCRLWGNVDKGDGCWLWTGQPGRGGYGVIGIGNRTTTSPHRVAYALEVGEIPCGLNVLHTCDVRMCVRPSHLFLGTTLDNMRDKVAKDRQAKGSFNGKAIVTEAIVLEMVADHAAGLNQREIAAKHGVAQTNVSSILRGLTWKHVPRPMIKVGRGGYATNGQHQRSAN